MPPKRFALRFLPGGDVRLSRHYFLEGLCGWDERLGRETSRIRAWVSRSCTVADQYCFTCDLLVSKQLIARRDSIAPKLVPLDLVAPYSARRSQPCRRRAGLGGQ